MNGWPALLQLTSASLPVGAFAYSQGLENAVARAIVTDEASAADWIEQVIGDGVARAEAVIVARVRDALDEEDSEALIRINRRWLASRETRELREETLQMGRSMRLLLAGMADVPPTLLAQLTHVDSDEGLGYPVAWSVAAWVHRIPLELALTGYLYAALENQVLAALKAVPLGHSAGQRLLTALGRRLPEWAAHAAQTPLDHITNFLPTHTLVCMHHEHQHTRLFRS